MNAKPIILSVVSIVYFVLALWFGEIIKVDSHEISFAILTKESVAIFGASIALYTATLNIFKFIYENLVLFNLHISCNYTINDNIYEFESSFINMSNETIYIKLVSMEGFSIHFDYLEIKPKESVLKKFTGIRQADTYDILNKTVMTYNYKNSSNINKFKIKRIKIYV
jgi:hypothetical protein